MLVRTCTICHQGNELTLAAGTVNFTYQKDEETGRIQISYTPGTEAQTPHEKRHLHVCEDHTHGTDHKDGALTILEQLNSYLGAMEKFAAAQAGEIDDGYEGTESSDDEEEIPETEPDPDRESEPEAVRSTPMVRNPFAPKPPNPAVKAIRAAARQSAQNPEKPNGLQPAQKIERAYQDSHLRAWAKSEGIEIGDRGQIKNWIRRNYEKAHGHELSV
ncbi:Lsr2 protein [Sinosporangium album]|uniref:Lsr2 protein n=1 Tax=Sinosporangium album TaxID=504805 RepID=A0A1G8AD52_9ACTN|nr:Lsr2 family protein [Sinosporangium album]SDH18766.1 Lsr2 protein [Sinosporangium album]